MSDIFVQFNGQLILVPGVTRFTTCDDVIEMMLYRTAEDRQFFSLYELCFGVERKLYGKASILKVIRSWGIDKKKFALLLRKTEYVTPSITSVSGVRGQFEKIRREILPRRDSISSDSNTIRNNLDKGNMKKLKEKVIESKITSTGSRIRRNRGKTDLMKRFLHDVMSQQVKQTKKVCRSKPLLRTPADGCSDTSEIRDSVVFDNDRDILNTCTCNVVSDSESAFEEGSDCSSVCDLERNILEHDMETESDFDSFDRLCGEGDNTELKSDKIKKMFSGSDIVNSGPDSEDADMESFMKTVIHDSDSDEGRRASSC